MRVPALLLVLVGLLGPAARASAQETFTDADFGFAMALPDGLHEATAAERARIMGVAEDAAKNVMRSESDGKAPITHHHFWVDRGSPYNRQMDVHLFDGPPPYTKAEDLVKAYTDTGLKVDKTEPMKAPVGGLRIEGTFVSQAGMPMRKTVVYLPDRAKYGIVSLQSFAGDWQIVYPEFLQSVLSIRMERQGQAGGAGPTAQAPGGPGPGPGGPGAGKGGKGKGGGKGQAKGGAPGEPGAEQPASVSAPARPVAWGSLPIAGSLVLSALLLGHLLLGGRSSR